MTRRQDTMKQYDRTSSGQSASEWRAIAAWLAFAGAMMLTGCSRRDVKSVSPVRGKIRSSFSEPAKTRLTTTYPITAPVSGIISRIGLRPGDPVKKGQVLAKYDLVPYDTAVKEAEAAVKAAQGALDEIQAGAEGLQARFADNANHDLEDTLRRQIDATIDALKEMIKTADAQIDAIQVQVDYADKNFQRVEKLYSEKSVSEQRVDDVRLEAETALIRKRQQEFNRAAQQAILSAMQLAPTLIDNYIERKKRGGTIIKKQIGQAGARRVQAESRLAQAKAQLAQAKHERDLAKILSPITGVVLARHDTGDRPVAAGTLLLTVGDLDDVEIVADVLTQDALKLSASTVVILSAAPGMPEFTGIVRRVEPAGFTKLSSLGVEQQRVNVIVGIPSRPAGLGVGFRVEARFIIGKADNALIVPRYCVLQAEDASYYVFVIENGKLKKQTVTIGLTSDLNMQVLDGVSESDSIVAAPDSTLKDGQSVNVQPKK